MSRDEPAPRSSADLLLKVGEAVGEALGRDLGELTSDRGPPSPWLGWLPVCRSRALAWRSRGCVRVLTVHILMGSMVTVSLSSGPFCPPPSRPTHHSPRPDGSS